MSLPTNEEVYNAIARVLACRDSRRGRKPALIVTIITNDDGKTVVTDHNTGCTAAIGKRKYTKRIPRHGDGTPIAKATVKAIKQGCEDSNNGKVTVYDPSVRISPVTGKPVRPYVKKADKVATLEKKFEQAVKPELTYKDSLTAQLTDVREQLSKAKIAREAIAGDPEKAKTVAVYDKVIAASQKLILELAAKLATI